MTDKPTPTDAELKAMWQLHAADIGGIFHYARAVLAKWGQPAQAEEPVAWVWRFSDGSFCETPFETQKACAQDAIGYEGEPVPLYLAPQPVAREPLTDEQIKDLQDDDVFFGSCRQIVRAIEAEHGIKGGQHGTE